MKVKTKFRIAGLIGGIIGLLSLITGISVLMGMRTPDYYVLPWLVVYNTILGFISVIVGFLIGSRHRRAVILAAGIAVFHFAVLGILFILLVTNHPVASQSIGAMVFRSFIWLGITLWISKTAKISQEVDL